MTPFADIISRARLGAFPDAPELAQLIRTQDFAQITDFSGEDNRAMQVEALLYMLANYPLTPSEAPRMLQDLDRGVVRLDFLTLSNPVPVFYEVPGHPALEQVRAALKNNMTTSKFRAAKAWQKWKALEKLGAYHKWENACLKRHRDSLPWPTSADYRQDSDRARQMSSVCGDSVRLHEQELRAHRASRHQKILALAGVQVSWLDVLKGLAKHLLTLPQATQLDN